jgi:hypothetical protein
MPVGILGRSYLGQDNYSWSMCMTVTKRQHAWGDRFQALIRYLPSLNGCTIILRALLY